jgi:Xaa-Pro aminopeptidase
MTTQAEPSAVESKLFQRDFPAEEFKERRAKAVEAIGPNAHALLQGAPPPRGFEPFRQSNEFYYLSGVEVPQAYLLLGGPSRTTRLYLPHRPERASAEGECFAAEDAELVKPLTGVDAVHPIEALAGHLQQASVLYTPHAPAECWRASRDTLLAADRLAMSDPWDGCPSREQHFIAMLRSRFPKAEVRDLSPTLDALRAIKSARELAVLRRAGELTALAVAEAMRATKPGMVEYELDAIARGLYVRHGARGEGYAAIVASGPNMWHGHYNRNDAVMRDGDLVLMDVAPDYHYYTSDIGRTWPVGGVYAPWQRELYGFIVEYHKTILPLIRPGRTADEIHAEAAAAMAKVVERTKFSKPIFEAAARRALEFKGHLSHPVGMAVHDVGGYGGGPLRPGLVFAVDPQLWVPEEKLYIRCEDTVAVTPDGIENLTASAPLDPSSVEAVIQR